MFTTAPCTWASLDIAPNGTLLLAPDRATLLWFATQCRLTVAIDESTNVVRFSVRMSPNRRHWASFLAESRSSRHHKPRASRADRCSNDRKRTSHALPTGPAGSTDLVTPIARQLVGRNAPFGDAVHAALQKIWPKCVLNAHSRSSSPDAQEFSIEVWLQNCNTDPSPRSSFALLLVGIERSETLLLLRKIQYVKQATDDTHKRCTLY